MARSSVGVCVAAGLAAMGAVLAVHFWTNSGQASATRPLVGVTWQGTEPNLTVVFTGDTVRIFDGCNLELRAANIGRATIDMGRRLGQGSGCTGTPGGPPRYITHFEGVMSSHHLGWELTGDSLRLIGDSGAAVRLRRGGPALEVADQEWRLEYFVGPHEYEHRGDSAARLRIQDGTVHATDVCNDLTGGASVTAITITFLEMQKTDRSCPDRASAALAAVVDDVLTGTVDYTIRGNELIIDGHPRDLLIYIPTD